MGTSLIINDREYITLSAAADLVGRSDTYIQQLAQGKWVNASDIQGMCFIDVESLIRFMQMLEEEEAKSSRSSSAVNELKVSDSDTADTGWVVIGKTGVVVLSGLLVGVLISTIVESDITLAELHESLMASTAMLGKLFIW